LKRSVQKLVGRTIPGAKRRGIIPVVMRLKVQKKSALKLIGRTDETPIPKAKRSGIG